MDLKLYLGPTLAALFVCAASPVFAQVVPAATEGNIPFSVGAGLSAYNPDLGHGHLLGGTLWIDYTLPHMPHVLYGLGIQAEGLDLNYFRSGSLPPYDRVDVASGGLIYSWPRYRDFRPYAKLMMGYGNADEQNIPFNERWTDSRTVTSGGAGLDYRVSRNVWLRVDYEYQSWPTFFKHPKNPNTGITPPAQRLKPQGFTIGAMYHFSHRH